MQALYVDEDEDEEEWKPSETTESGMTETDRDLADLVK